MNDKTYICSLCGGEFNLIRDDTWNEEMAKEEYNRLFPDSKWEDREIVCDECWQLVKPMYPWYE